MAQVYSLTEFLVADFPHRSLIGGDMLDSGEKMMIFGESEAGKSYLIIQLALDLGTASPFLGYDIPVRSRVLVLQSELSERRYRERFARLSATYPLEPEIWVCTVENMKVDVEPRRRELGVIIQDIEPDVVMIDPLRAFFQGDENSSQDIERLFTGFAELQTMTPTPFSLIYAHHVRKPPPGFSASTGKASVRGSSLVVDRPSTILGLEVNATQDVWTLHTVKARNRDKRPDAMVLDVSPETGLFVLKGTIDTSMRFEGLVELVGDGTDLAALTKELYKQKGWKARSSAYDYVRKAIAQGILRSEKIDGTKMEYITVVEGA